MPVTMICPNLACRQTVVASDTARGKIVRCAYCGQPFLVPGRGAPPPPPKDDIKAKAKAKATDK